MGTSNRGKPTAAPVVFGVGQEGKSLPLAAESRSWKRGAVDGADQLVISQDVRKVWRVEMEAD